MKEKFAVIGGSGGYDILRDNCFGPDLECKKILTPFGESAPIHKFSNDGVDLLFLSRHGEDRYSVAAPFINYHANIWALKECGVERILSWSGPGIINKNYSVGDFVLPHDIIDETKNRDYTFFKNRGLGFIRQQFPFCPEIKDKSRDVIKNLNLNYHDKGVYLCTEGPRLETPAEINKYKLFGADMVGMTLIPETFLARELEICYAPICYMTNFAEGVSKRKFEKGKLFEGMVDEEERAKISDSIRKFPMIIQNLIKRMKEMERCCDCKDAMLRYKKQEIITDDWHEWIN